MAPRMLVDGINGWPRALPVAGRAAALVEIGRETATERPVALAIATGGRTWLRDKVREAARQKLCVVDAMSLSCPRWVDGMVDVQVLSLVSTFPDLCRTV